MYFRKSDLSLDPGDWEEMRLVEHKGTPEETRHRFYRMGPYGVEEHDDGRFQAYVVAGGHPFMVEEGFPSFAEAVARLKGEADSKGLSSERPEDAEGGSFRKRDYGNTYRPNFEIRDRDQKKQQEEAEAIANEAIEDNLEILRNTNPKRASVVTDVMREYIVDNSKSMAAKYRLLTSEKAAKIKDKKNLELRAMWMVIPKYVNMVFEEWQRKAPTAEKFENEIMRCNRAMLEALDEVRSEYAPKYYPYNRTVYKDDMGHFLPGPPGESLPEDMQWKYYMQDPDLKEFVNDPWNLVVMCAYVGVLPDELQPADDYQFERLTEGLPYKVRAVDEDGHVMEQRLEKRMFMDPDRATARDMYRQNNQGYLPVGAANVTNWGNTDHMSRKDMYDMFEALRGEEYGRSPPSTARGADEPLAHYGNKTSNEDVSMHMNAMEDRYDRYFPTLRKMSGKAPSMEEVIRDYNDRVASEEKEWSRWLDRAKREYEDVVAKFNEERPRLKSEIMLEQAEKLQDSGIDPYSKKGLARLEEKAEKELKKELQRRLQDPKEGITPPDPEKFTIHDVHPKMKFNGQESVRAPIHHGDLGWTFKDKHDVSKELGRREGILALQKRTKQWIEDAPMRDPITPENREKYAEDRGTDVLYADRNIPDDLKEELREYGLPYDRPAYLRFLPDYRRVRELKRMGVDYEPQVDDEGEYVLDDEGVPVPYEDKKGRRVPLEYPVNRLVNSYLKHLSEIGGLQSEMEPYEGLYLPKQFRDDIMNTMDEKWLKSVYRKGKADGSIEDDYDDWVESNEWFPDYLEKMEKTYSKRPKNAEEAAERERKATEKRNRRAASASEFIGRFGPEFFAGYDDEDVHTFFNEDIPMDKRVDVLADGWVKAFDRKSEGKLPDDVKKELKKTAKDVIKDWMGRNSDIEDINADLKESGYLDMQVLPERPEYEDVEKMKKAKAEWDKAEKAKYDEAEKKGEHYEMKEYGHPDYPYMPGTGVKPLKGGENLKERYRSIMDAIDDAMYGTDVMKQLKGRSMADAAYMHEPSRRHETTETDFTSGMSPSEKEALRGAVKEVREKYPDVSAIVDRGYVNEGDKKKKSPAGEEEDVGEAYKNYVMDYVSKVQDAKNRRMNETGGDGTAGNEDGNDDGSKDEKFAASFDDYVRLACSMRFSKTDDDRDVWPENWPPVNPETGVREDPDDIPPYGWANYYETWKPYKPKPEHDGKFARSFDDYVRDACDSRFIKDMHSGGEPTEDEMRLKSNDVRSMMEAARARSLSRHGPVGGNVGLNYYNEGTVGVFPVEMDNEYPIPKPRDVVRHDDEGSVRTLRTKTRGLAPPYKPFTSSPSPWRRTRCPRSSGRRRCPWPQTRPP